MSEGSLTFRKNERLYGKLLIDQLFSKGNRCSLAAFPLRVVYRFRDRIDGELPERVLISVPKRCFKRAVKRNRVKRQIREAFRKNKQILLQNLPEQSGSQILMAFLWQDTRLHDTAEIEKKVISLLQQMSERI
ncbi:MAG: ribonuclease P protein component [Prevotella sp.]|jgi:ribonuclease P protein component|nr:ribonuclease P protein component [Prevotella sp.]MCH3994992.1 ribonuclease P protein component [Prevotella sp.]MCI1246785.1 ribonuclease P protein component [Prevotella sp.]